MNDHYRYAEERFSQARRYLMLPPRGKKALAISQACKECELGLQDLSMDKLDYKAQDHVSQLKKLILRNHKLNAAEKHDLCESINYLAYYFHDRWTEVWG